MAVLAILALETPRACAAGIRRGTPSSGEEAPEEGLAEEEKGSWKTIRIGGGASADAEGRNSNRTSPEGATLPVSPPADEMGDEEAVEDIGATGVVGMSGAIGLSSSREERDSSSPQ